MKKLFSILLVFLIVSCQPRSKTQYVDLNIPEVLKSNKEAVERLQTDAERANRLFNSTEDMVKDITFLMKDLILIVDSLPEEEIDKRVKSGQRRIEMAGVKMSLNNFSYLGGRVINEMNEDSFIATLSPEEAEAYKKIGSGIAIKREAMEEKSRRSF